MKLNSLYDKEIISIIDGTRLGEISDLEINENTGEILQLIISGRLRLFGLLGRREPVNIPWGNVRVIGEETILVDTGYNTFDNNKSKSIIQSFLD